MTRRRVKITLIHHPTVALKIFGFASSEFEAFIDSGLYLGNVYRRIIPASLARVASVMEKDLLADVNILDLRVTGCDREETYKTINWEGYEIEARRVGSPFAMAEQAISESDWIGLSSHFTFESGVILDLIRYAKKVNPKVKVMVGGADASARPHDYIRGGADLCFVGDFDPQALTRDYAEPAIVGPYRHPFADLTKPSLCKLQHLSEYKDSHDGPVPEGVPFPIGFLYFTRGCPRECDFCESRKTQYEHLSLELAVSMLENYRAAGIRTLNLADDNLLLQAANKDGRQTLLSLLGAMREMGFAWEFPNGLEIGRLLKDGVVDEELTKALFFHTIDPNTGYLVGAYRVYIPVETFDHREQYRKLKPVEEQNKILAAVARAGLPEIDFGVVLPPDADHNTFDSIREGYLRIKEIIKTHGDTKARYSVFHLIPIAEFRQMHTKYSVEKFPEGWNFYFPVYDGSNFTARELFEERLRLVKEVDLQSYENMRKGQYGYS
jgi:radical SAM superfamily enzyme YgiQ (UPF0313 family)